jgi:hypothetical protein
VHTGTIQARGGGGFNAEGRFAERLFFDKSRVASTHCVFSLLPVEHIFLRQDRETRSFVVVRPSSVAHQLLRVVMVVRV